MVTASISLWGTSQSGTIRRDQQKPILWFPHDTGVLLIENQVDLTWQLINKHEQPQRIVQTFVYISNQKRVNVDQERRALIALKNEDEYIQRALQYGGFVTDYLYLKLHKHSERHVTSAALMNHLLISFWNEQAVAGDIRALLALPMLWRSYLRSIEQLQQFLSPKLWEAWWRMEYNLAMEQWQQICLSDDHAWFFSDWLTDWVDGTHWQNVREQEVQYLVWQEPQHALCFRTVLGEQFNMSIDIPFQLVLGFDRGFGLAKPANGRSLADWKGFLTAKSQLRSPDMSTTSGQRRYRFLIEKWYLPQYDIITARRLQWRLAWNTDDHWSIVLLPALGVARLWAGVIVGYAVTALQGDTWRIISQLISEQPNRQAKGVILGLALGLGAFLYLLQGISRRTSVDMWKRAFGIWVRGEVFSFLLGLATAGLLFEFAPDGTNRNANIIFIALIYAQLALFIGIFTQLLFDEKPTTMPLDAP